MIVWGEIVRWYVCSARHPFKKKIIGRYWSMFCSRPLWIRYGADQIILVNIRDYIQQKIFFDGYYERDLVEWLRKELLPTDVFWDVGANIGAMTLVASPLCRAVVAFEPEPHTLDHLQQNIDANSLTNVSVQALALSDAGGIVDLSLGPESNSGMHSISRRAVDRATVQVRAVRADTLVERGELPRPNVMKVDVEGAEEQVLCGAGGLLAFEGLRAIVFEAREGAGHLPENTNLVALLARHAFRIEVFGRSDLQATDGMNNYLATRSTP